MKHIIIHHTGGTERDPFADTSHHTVHTVDNAHRARFGEPKSSRGWYVGYHHFIDRNGNITKAREHTELGGAHKRT